MIHEPRHVGSGKVRELFAVGDDRLLLVASDRISAYDVVLPQAIPDKGKVLTALSDFWFDQMAGVCPNHRISVSASDISDVGMDDLAGRSMLCKRCDPIPIEFVVRGYLSGSGWKEYRSTGTVCGHQLPGGLQESGKLPEPILTPATKAVTGHDENITEERAAEIAGAEIYETARSYALEIYRRAAELAAARGVIIADTKFEFGIAGGEVTLIDEVLTPDSSRFWPADAYEPGRSQPSFDKQYVRDWLDASGWDHNPPPPELPGEVVDATRARYVEAYERVTGRPFTQWLEEVNE
ncbi:MAG TPA: phosphoribosylaminoimidazolesuccinocarboxamide synthase [Actinomycetota bacterium]|nr:phosphoribosylaminoimidazolesuccinocarboxamide synthase [Actinomycetota bacterium]